MQNSLEPSDHLIGRHIGPRDDEIQAMLRVLGFDSLSALSDATIPASIRNEKELVLDGLPQQPLGEAELLGKLRALASENQLSRSWIGMGYSDTIVPGVIQRNTPPTNPKSPRADSRPC